MKINNSTPNKENEDVVLENSGFSPVDPEEVQYYKMLKELKRLHKRLYVTEIAGEKIIWRPLKRSEYKEAWALEFPEGTDQYDIMFERETFIANKVVLYPKDAVDNLACCAEIVTDLCMAKSGFIEKKDPTCEGI